MLKRASGIRSDIPVKTTMTIEERDNLIVLQGKKLAALSERNGNLELENLALRRELKTKDAEIESLKKQIPASLDTKDDQNRLCVCGETARWHCVIGGAGVAGTLGSCFKPTSKCRKFIPANG